MARIIVDSMSYEEVFELFREDLTQLNHKIEAATKKMRKKYRNARNSERHYFTPIKYQSQRGFNYVLQFFDNGINVPREARLGFYYYTWYIQRKGVYAMMLSQLNRQVWHFTIYTPHFFDRYKERFLKDKTISTPDAIYTFFTRNPKSSTQGVPSEKYPNGYWAICNDGICLCNHLNGFTIEAKTFIDWSLLYKGQQDLAIKAKEFMLEKGFELNVPVEDFDDYMPEPENSENW